MNLQVTNMVANGSSNELATPHETVQEQLEFEFMAEIQKPEQMEFAFVHIEEGTDQ